MSYLGGVYHSGEGGLDEKDCPFHHPRKYRLPEEDKLLPAFLVIGAIIGCSIIVWVVRIFHG